MKTQATRATPEEVRIHITRQRFLGERMIPRTRASHLLECLVLTLVFGTLLSVMI